MPDFKELRRGVRVFTSPALIDLLRLPEDSIITGCLWDIEAETLLVGYRSEDTDNTVIAWEHQFVSPNQGGGRMGVIIKDQIDVGDYPHKKVTDDA